MGQTILWFLMDIRHVAEAWWYDSPVLLTVAFIALITAGAFSLRRT
jgi:hypothetical protein